MKKILLAIALGLSLSSCNTLINGGGNGTDTGGGTTPIPNPQPKPNPNPGAVIGNISFNTISLTITHCSRALDGTTDVICFARGKSSKDDSLTIEGDYTRLVDKNGKSYLIKSIYRSDWDKAQLAGNSINFIAGIDYSLELRFPYSSENLITHFDLDLYWKDIVRFSNITLK